MNTLVIGASGYLGSEIYSQCAKAGHNTTGTYARNPVEGMTHFDVENPESIDLPEFDVIVWAIQGYKAGTSNAALEKIADLPDTRFIYVSSVAAVSRPALRSATKLGDYARTKRDEEEILKGSGALLLRIGPVCGENSSGQLDTRTQAVLDKCRQNKPQRYWTNVFQTFEPVKKVASFVVDNLGTNITGAYFVGPDTKESYFDYYRRTAIKYGVDSSLIQPDELSQKDAARLGILLDGSFSTHPNRIEL